MKYNGIEVKPVAPEVGQWRRKPPGESTRSVVVRVEHIWETSGCEIVELYDEEGKYCSKAFPDDVAAWPVVERGDGIAVDVEPT
jgi:hypothetical protein